MSEAYREYDRATIEKLQNVLRSMLGDFDALCKKHGLRYFAGGGTAIGALRHGGMIPWDDDIDVCLLRDDYEKFLSLAETEYGDKYYVLNNRTHPDYPLPTTRWCLRGTIYREECMKYLGRVPFGIFLDVCAFDPIPDDDRAARRQWRRAWFWGKLAVLRGVRSPVFYGGGIRARLVAAACFAGHYLLRAATGRRFLAKRAEFWARRSEGKPGCSRAAWMFDTKLYASQVMVEAVRNGRSVPFDGGTIELSADVDAYLRRHFGDYMQIPPPEKRHNHPPRELDFGPFGGTGKGASA